MKRESSQEPTQESFVAANAHENPQQANAEQVGRKRAAHRLLRAEICYAFALVAFALLAAFAHFYSYFNWDLRATRALQSLDAPGLSAFMVFISLFGNRWTPHAITFVTVLIFLYFRRRSEAFGLLLSAGGIAIINTILKIIIARPRPSANLVRVYRDINTNSFPSGHVTFYVCYFGFLFFAAFALLPRNSLKRRLVLIACAFPVLLVGISRVYLGAHWASDTIGAYLLSSTWLAFSLHLYRRWKERATFHREDNSAATNAL